ncbi:hypothetical protein [Mammaliicoccus sciuri]|uniref:hypothetical protein n=1 Tax=Mammaliicoccus sciuri TaxID=1296 RepID=UPI001A9A000C|nr:hypothetical protein [Mammaliicoccus sciuri]MBO1219958.1 hypothetical protein [Mammaliicoccus sciuri]MBO1232097.1 hypothetical protein [Mammaliicoccus sciuri]MCJ0917238.1 hypothetical protein [Mammaliicoccus sciuri]MCJ0938087.1 hypothetical protein [Mammaliicoccus sciuri]MEB7394172.1 hypothetical protein [Mammaliicoccus sciuri]
MQKSKAIKELFKVQELNEKFSIIKEYNLDIKGFSNITYELLEQNEKYISNQVSSIQNIKKITNRIKSHIKREQNLDYLLSVEKIIEKYNKNFLGLLVIFENDQYGQLTESIIEELILEPQIKEDQDKSTIEDKEEVFRSLIKTLETKIQNKDQKIKEVITINKELENKMKTYEVQIKKLSNEIKIKDSKLNDKNEILQSKIDELEQLKEANKAQYNKNFYNKEDQSTNDPLINIIGAPDFWKIDTPKNFVFFNDDEIDSFIESYQNSNNSLFYVVKFGVTAYIARMLKKQLPVFFINSKDEFESLIKGELK